MLAESLRRKAQKALYYKKNRKRILAHQLEYQFQNKEKRLAYLHSWLARKRKPIKPKTEVTKKALWLNEKRFGGLWLKTIIRDKEKCVNCRMKRKAHWVEFGCDLTVDHINGIGRNSGNPDNRMENLQTLCRRCHGRKDLGRAPHIVNKRLK